MAYIKLDKIKATAHLESVVATEDLVNGQFLALGELQADGEARLATPSGDVSEDLVYHVSNGLVYRDDENELDFVLKAGKEGRGYVLETGNIVSVSADGITEGADKGDIVVPSATGWAIHTAPEAPEGLQGKVIAVDFDAIAGQMFVVRVKA
jgi:hypothetical protein